MTIPHYTVPYIFWRPGKVYGMHKMCITGGSFLSGTYLKGERAPRYPVPAIPVKVGYMPSGSNEMEGVPYAYVTTDTLCWTFWKNFGLVEERR